MSKPFPSPNPFRHPSTFPPTPKIPPLGLSLRCNPKHPYLATRGLSPETIAEFDLGFCATGPLRNRIAIPVHDAQGQVIGYAGRWPGAPPPTDVADRGRRRSSQSRGT